MESLILLSHGSRREASNREMMALADAMSELKDNPFGQVRCAFQQFAEPTFETVVEELVHEKIDRIVVFPLFLSSGSHVLEDVPELVSEIKKKFPQLEIKLTTHLGGMRNLAGFLLKSILEQSVS